MLAHGPRVPLFTGLSFLSVYHQLFPTPYAPTWIRKLTVRPSSAAHTVGTACLPEPGLAVCSSRVGACPVSSSRAGARPSRSCSRCRSSRPDRKLAPHRDPNRIPELLALCNHVPRFPRLRGQPTQEGRYRISRLHLQLLSSELRGAGPQSCEVMDPNLC